MLGDGGLDFLLDWSSPSCCTPATPEVEEGGFVEVKAAEGDLVEVRGRDAAAFARIAWHLGNRHLPAETPPTASLIRDDHVIVDMLKGLGAEVRKVKAPFDPKAAPMASTTTISAIATGPCTKTVMVSAAEHLLPDRGPPGPLMNHEAGGSRVTATLDARGPMRRCVVPAFGDLSHGD